MYKTLIYTLLFTCLIASQTQAQTPLKPRAEVNWRYNHNRSILMSEFWLPMAQSPTNNSVIYGDLRFMGDGDNNREFNLGIGYRQQLETALLGDGIAGAHLWYDRRHTARDSGFNQLTAGLEWLGQRLDLRLNTYLPIGNDDETYLQANPNGNGTGFVGNQIFVNTDQSVVEEALPGVDIEIGFKVPFMDALTDTTRLYAGGYHFKGDQAENVTGWRTRIDSVITPDISLGARFQHDDERGSQGFLEASLRFPFGTRQRYQQQGLRARLDESPVRDIDIVAGESFVDDGLDKPLLNATTGASQNIIHVDNTAVSGGDGSNEARFNTLAAAETAAGPNDLIYLHRGDGTTTGQDAGIILDDPGQMLVGGGADLTFDSTRFKTANNQAVTGVVIPASGAPLITHSAGPGVKITDGGDDVLVSGVTVDGDGTSIGIGITSQGNNVTIKNNQVKNANGNNIRISPLGSDTITTLVQNNILTNGNNRGFAAIVNSGTLILNLVNNTATNNVVSGYEIRTGSISGNITATLSGNTSSGNAISGFHIDDNNSTGSFTVDMGGGTLGSTGGNSAFSNTTQDLFVDLDGAELKAENNWWGTPAGLLPARVTLDSGSTVDADPFLNAAP